MHLFKAIIKCFLALFFFVIARSPTTKQSPITCIFMHERNYYVYIMTNPGNTVLYIGVTGDIAARVHQHKEKSVEGFTKRYGVTKLVHVEVFSEAYDALTREKQIKGGPRQKKIDLIVANNPTWSDLTPLLT